MWEWVSDQVFKMVWLNDLAGRLLEFFGMSLDSKLGSSLQFFIFDTIKIFILLSVLIFTMGVIQSFFPPEKTKVILGGLKGWKGNILGALLGTVTPFCSCSSIPIFIGFTTAGLPLGVTFSFLISSPMVDIASIILLMSFFGAKIAILYVIVGLFLAVIGGTIIDKLGMENEIQDYIRKMEDTANFVEELTWKDRFRFGVEQVKEVAGKVWPYVIIGVGIGAAIHNWIPESFIQTVLGKDNPFAVVLATVIGAPIYADIFGVLPIAEALFSKGVPIGTLVSFMMAVTTLSLPSLIMLSKVVKPKLLALFIGICVVGILLIGFAFNLLPI
ncbi:permease [Enterococcus pseudoavium]|uniref:Permease n=1 Tax=Enterococcus pseudoavium TaxID=44007 RepID=A0ABU3FFV3_9ENTE|nr:permease [Enterococcus pseudoavium]MDT2754295.1 permease [Enterococcus pseudoavium]MDT2769923.1 permease [Enterococcus pseudoavium]